MTDQKVMCIERAKFFGCLHAALQDSPDSRRPLAVLLLDLDRFKDINFAWGHAIGDRVLIKVAERLQSMLQESDVCVRIGDDEFGLLLPAVMNIGHATLAASKIQNLMQEPFEVNGSAIDIRASIGVALFPQHGADVDRLMHHVDTALCIAKRSGCGFAIYDKDETKAEPSQLSLEAELREAIGEGELALHYQPKISLKSGRISGLEALVRWDNPKRGFMAPDMFIPMAEQTGLIQPLTIWVLNSALRQCVAFAGAGIELNIAVNLSPRNLHDEELPLLVQRALETWGASPAHLVLEITENAMMEDPAYALGILKSLSDMGISLAIDDFGSGYSSLSYLSKLPVNELKIDKSFVLHMAEKEDDAMIVRSVIELARNFKLSAVAEGVENKETWDMLSNLGCDHAQGYYMSRPVPLEKLREWMSESPWGLGQERTSRAESS